MKGVKCTALVFHGERPFPSLPAFVFRVARTCGFRKK